MRAAPVRQMLRRVAGAGVRRMGLSVLPYRWSPQARRQQLLDSLRIDLVVDVGANVGQYGLELRRHGYRSRLLSFEPLTRARLELETAARRDSNWQCRAVALGATRKMVDIHGAESSNFSSVLSPSSALIALEPGARVTASESVQQSTLDHELADEQFGRLGIKVDVQGYEMEVFAGAVEALSVASLVEVELSIVPMYNDGLAYREVTGFLSDRGFELGLIIPGYCDERTGRQLEFNGVFIRPEALDPSGQRA